MKLSQIYKKTKELSLKKGLYDLIEPYQREIIFRDEPPKMIEDKGSDEDLIQLGDDEDLIQL